MSTTNLLLLASGVGITYLVILDRRREQEIAALRAQLAAARRRKPSTLEQVADIGLGILTGIF